ncbi:MAG: hypothetical protein IKP64_14105 [Selenomonadaceae bacterium]|nr:hypothetical protein [Selenomonadaceae bacterium]
MVGIDAGNGRRADKKTFADRYIITHKQFADLLEKYPFGTPFLYFAAVAVSYENASRRSVGLGAGATKIFLNTKGTHGDITPALKNFPDFVDSGIIVGAFVSELAKAVDSIKRNEKVRHDFMTLQMALLDERRATEKSVRESVALKMLNKGKPLEEIAELTDLPIRRIEELEKDNDNRDT